MEFVITSFQSLPHDTVLWACIRPPLHWNEGSDLGTSEDKFDILIYPGS